ncbi:MULTISPECIES: acyl carrier protein [Clostridium]|uniref:Acyl carrier protein n=1 Tax=Clostridium cadaveris TaxID=1529 RepID=A0A1I2JBN5_9CLOT|nr:acyl carrier protein [Clostridium cadaveris]MDU4953152.1 acyl carrier protein [Clostridium sp.]MDM8311086.1 acyl carrier protein [Clostridium cadaveris]MDY4950560.1 acyl carrier protein [Clostridium cadaveris]NME64163.1 acyl carrier protein [Clostridium cadaveris]NWK11728.1 acyl carrier protein [Clostridium cadaveris]
MVLDKIKSIVADKLSINADDITMDTTLEDLGADSLDVVEVIMALEDEFDIEISDEVAENISTVGDLVEYIKAHVEE